MIILGLDLSTKNSGYSIFKDNELIEYGCINAGSANLFHRIDKMVTDLEQIISRYSIDHVYLEDIYPEDVHNNIQVYKALCYLQGFILHLLDHYKIEHTFFIPSEWRAKCGIRTGRGIKRDTLKAKDIEFVKNQFDIMVGDDAADAIGIGFAGIGGVPKQVETKTTKTDDDFEFL